MSVEVIGVGLFLGRELPELRPRERNKTPMLS